jgi:hypothetical protein
LIGKNRLGRIEVAEDFLCAAPVVHLLAVAWIDDVLAFVSCAASIDAGKKQEAFRLAWTPVGVMKTFTG